ncbi:hypothetical protein [Methylobrevis pamukkalensis]|uniref:Uncharacterized protein n=1 Tax=Methylobrevis pamukkalensis TaxID=1439726 RepID=A0A1E3GZQ2_9HYPH|nr:hypothetical protein [Methylobrevis pamukkalensis]ODN69549.1 hypothetical protein A6302_03143 [Methylobrevis pamukkalensis]
MAYESAEVSGLLILTPCYKGLSSGYVTSLWDTQEEMRARGVPCGLVHVAGDAIISHARNLLMAKFLAAERFSHALLVDADQEWPASAVVRLLAAGFGFSACGVPKRTEPLTWNFHPRPGPTLRDARTGFVRIERIGTGFMMLRREVVASMAAAPDIVRFRHDEAGETTVVPELFRPGVIGGTWFGEDYAFCRRWTDSGGEIWLDPEQAIRHEGTHLFDAGCPDGLFPRGDLQEGRACSAS